MPDYDFDVIDDWEDEEIEPIKLPPTHDDEGFPTEYGFSYDHSVTKKMVDSKKNRVGWIVLQKQQHNGSYRLILWNAGGILKHSEMTFYSYQTAKDAYYEVKNSFQHAIDNGYMKS